MARFFVLHYSEVRNSEGRNSRDFFSGCWPCYPRCVVGQVRIVTAHLFNFGRTGLHFALWLVSALLAFPPPPFFKAFWGGGG